ncbi:MAG TPA: molecular chaperone DnaJ, partial [Anaeromyxobacter sp.]|nr:molecular chaperone DnaJ [Anaeromyxobacter sp.]
MKPLAEQNLYEILDVPFDATAAAIAEAVDRVQALYAPGSLATYTLMDPEEEQLLARRIEEARVTLLDPAARARYDERLTEPAEPVQVVPPAMTPATRPVLDAAIRAAWPELPPVIPALRIPVEEDWEEEPPARPSPPEEAPVAAVPEPPPVAAQAPAPRPAPILLNHEIPAAPPAPVLTPVPLATPAPGSSAPVPTPIPLTASMGGSAAAAIPAPAAVEGASWSGEVLRQLREARGLSLQQVSDRTKVTRHHI